MFLATSHNHQHCVENAIEEAAHVCADKGMRFTRVRRQVLELIWDSHEPIGAYAILEGLRDGFPNAAPTTVYRALDFLTELGLIHRIESLNAFVGCSHPREAHTGQFLICAACGKAAELDDPNIEKAISKSADRLGFRAQRQTIEVTGLCPNCQ